MRAIDTNVIVRFLTGDDSEQSPRARAAMQSGDLLLTTSVTLECEWVLRSAFGYKRVEIAESLDLVAGIEGLTVQEPEVLFQAIAWLRGGMDFADALHLASSNGCDVMLSFDDDMIKAAKKLGAMQVRSP